MNKKQQDELWAQLATLLTDAEKVLQEIIVTKAWKGYKTFFDAYTDKLKNITLAPELLPYVTYQMIEEGRTDMDIALNVKGVGPQTVASLRSQRAQGVAPGNARVRAYYRRTPQEPWQILVGVGAAKRKRIQKKAYANNLTIEEWVIQWIDKGLRDK